MAAVHPDIEILLVALDQAGLTTLADIARGRLDDADDPQVLVLQHPKERIPPDGVFAMQRDIVAEVVETVVQRELKMRRRMRSLTGKLQLEGMRELEPLDAGAELRFRVADNFASRENERLLTDFLTAWNDIIRDLGGRPGEFHAG